MKATINGIVVEGTPKEIVEFQKLHDDLRRDGVHIKPQIGPMPDWIKKEIGGSTYVGSTGDINLYCKRDL